MSNPLPTDVTNLSPAPWSLTGSGLIIPFWLKHRFRLEHFPRWQGRLAIMMFVNYTTSPVGPYREWMLIPGKVNNPRGRHFSIGEIRVNSEESVIGGQANWGIPKALADFEFEQSESSWQMGMGEQQRSVAVRGRLAGPSFPVHSGLLPFTIYQQRRGVHFWTRPKARGWGRLIKLQTIDIQGFPFAPLSHQSRLGAIAITQFNMTFPTAMKEPA